MNIKYIKEDSIHEKVFMKVEIRNSSESDVEKLTEKENIKRGWELLGRDNDYIFLVPTNFHPFENDFGMISSEQKPKAPKKPRSANNRKY